MDRPKNRLIVYYGVLVIMLFGMIGCEKSNDKPNSEVSVPPCVKTIEGIFDKAQPSPLSIPQIADYKWFTNTPEALDYLKSKGENLVAGDGSSIYPELVLREYDNESFSFNDRIVENDDIVIVSVILNYTESGTVFHASPAICIDGELTERAKKIVGIE